MDIVLIVFGCALLLCILLTAFRSVCLRVTRSKLLESELPFTVYVSIKKPDEAEYIVRSVMERIKWLDLYGMCRVVCLNPANDPEIDEIIRKLTRKYPFAEIGAFQTRKNVL